MAGLDRQQPVITCQGFIQALCRQQGMGMMGARRNIFRTAFDRLVQQQNGFVQLALLALQKAQHVQSGKVARIGAQNLAIKSLGLREMTSAMSGEALLEKLTQLHGYCRGFEVRMVIDVKLLANFEAKRH